MAKPKLALIPASQGSELFSVLPSSGVGDFDFTRSGSATRINSQGLIEEVANGQSRLNYPMIDGKVVGCPHHILEPARTNLFTYSEDFENSDWTKNAGTTITNNYAISPDGSLNASRYLGTGASGLGDKFTLSATSYTISFYVKSNTSENQYCRLIGDSSNVSENLLITTEWTRLSYTFTGSGLSNKTNGIFRDSNDNDIDVLIYGAQLEQGSYPTSYIPNYGTAAGVTRSAETANGSGDASTFNDSEGVLMFEGSTDIETTVKAITLGDGTSNNRIQLFYFNGASIYGACIVGGVSQASQSTNIDVSTNIKVAFKYKANDFALWVNGFKVGVDTNGAIPTGLEVLNFDNGTGTSDFYGKTKQLQYFQTTLTDSELEELTSWESFKDMADGQLYTIE